MLADLTIHETVRDELKNLDLAGRRIRAHLTARGRSEGDHCAAASRAAPRRGCLEPATVIAVPVQDLLALGGVHVSGIGLPSVPL